VSAPPGAPHHGVYLPDVVNQGTRVNTGLANGIVIRGRFSGCTFALCMGADSGMQVTYTWTRMVR
jgi:hypothetical protein